MKKKNFMYAIISASIFGLMPFMTIVMYNYGCNSLSAVFYRFFYSALVLYVLALKESKGKLTYTKKELKQLMFLSLNFILTPIFLFASYTYINSGVSTTLHFLYPVIIAITHIIISHTKVKLNEILSLASASIGIVLLIDIKGEANIYGVVLAILSAITFAIYSIYFELSGLTKMGSYKLSFFTASSTSLTALILCLVKGEFFFILDKNFILFSIIYSLLILFFGILYYQKSIRIIGAKDTSILSTLEPVISVFIGTFFLGQKTNLKMLLGVIFIIISAIIVLMFNVSKENA
ncbi:DMT family transporter [Peptoniphilus hominis (ex Hitch et al. 2025)]|uniref:DMT family transporter n=1 Tax=Peptoniphilus hominis (ex Hitch et al. 2025) TaxID=3133174 RepID=A0ABV1CF54_9FIRM